MGVDLIMCWRRQVPTAARCDHQSNFSLGILATGLVRLVGDRGVLFRSFSKSAENKIDLQHPLIRICGQTLQIAGRKLKQAGERVTPRLLANSLREQELCTHSGKHFIVDLHISQRTPHTRCLFACLSLCRPSWAASPRSRINHLPYLTGLPEGLFENLATLEKM